MDAPTLSLIVPLHNELPNLPRLLDACIAVLERTGESWEILLIDDGSDDGSWVFVQQVMAADERVRGLRHPQRLGKTLAYATGFRAAQGRYLFTLDADLQEEPSAIHAMLQQLRHEADMVVGWRKVRRDAPLKVLASKVFNAVLRWGLRLPLHDANCGFKGMRRRWQTPCYPTWSATSTATCLSSRIGWGFEWRRWWSRTAHASMGVPTTGYSAMGARCTIYGRCCDDCESATIIG
jgi:glycosyltransferase involved in cell wall biosynthesis